MLSVVPLNVVSNQSFGIKVPVDGNNLSLQLTLTYNELAKYWVLNISNSAGEALISGLPVVPSRDLLEQYKYLGIGSAYLVPTQTVVDQWPNTKTLGSEWYLLWGDTDGSDLMNE